MKTYNLTNEEVEMIVDGLRAHESEFCTTAPESKAYFAKVLALADRLESEVQMAVEAEDKAARRTSSAVEMIGSEPRHVNRDEQ